MSQFFTETVKLIEDTSFGMTSIVAACGRICVRGGVVLLVLSGRSSVFFLVFLDVSTGPVQAYFGSFFTHPTASPSKNMIIDHMCVL